MRRCFDTVAASAVLAAVGLVGLAHGQDTATTWKDPSKHEVRYVTVDKGVTLEVLDWGGSVRSTVIVPVTCSFVSSTAGFSGRA